MECKNEGLRWIWAVAEPLFLGGLHYWHFYVLVALSSTDLSRDIVIFVLLMLCS